MGIIKPNKLNKGDTLGVIAPSTPISKAGNEVIERGYSYLRSKGFKIVEAPNCRKTQGHSAGTVKERSDVLNSFFTDPKINGIIAFWGGFQSHQLLEYLDYKSIKQNPKPLIGFSDITALQVGIFAKTGLVTFSGPGVITFGKPTQFEYTWEYFEKVLMQTASPIQVFPS